jgi:hypothetical protein
VVQQGTPELARQQQAAVVGQLGATGKSLVWASKIVTCKPLKGPQACCGELGIGVCEGLVRA